MRTIAIIAALAALFIIACGDETDPAPNGGKTTGQVLFDAYKNYKEGSDSTDENTTKPESDPATGMPCDEKEGIDSNGDGVVTNCDGGSSEPGYPGQPDGGYGAMPLCPEIIGLNFDTCRPEMGRPVFIIDFGRSCVLGMKCDYNGTEPACPMVWDPVCGTDGWTYDNECFAKVAGVGVAYMGECIGEPYPCPPIEVKEPFCEDGSYPEKMFDETGCFIGFECVWYNDPNCPDLAYPGPDFCPNGKIEYTYNQDTGCHDGFVCIEEGIPSYCNTDADCGEGMYCVNGVCNYGDPFECPAIDLKMPDCGTNMKPEPIYDAAGCLIDWACPL